jgi:outer membrane protein
MRNQISWLLLISTIFLSRVLHGQDHPQVLPTAPAAQLFIMAQVGQSQPSGMLTTSLNSADPATPLTRRQAEYLAIRNNPRISVAALLALAQKQIVSETRSAELPTLDANFTGVSAEEGTRLSSGTLSASRLLNHLGGGVELNQLITDFGRTHNLIASSSLQAKASEANAQATREEIILAVDLAFYSALEAQATAQVAQSTATARQAVSDQVTALTASKLKSTLDQSFADVNLSQAKLLVLDSQNQANAAMARLSEILGSGTLQTYRLVDDNALPTPELPANPDSLIAVALQQRPDLQALDLSHKADQKFSRAQHEQLLPTVSALGIVGGTPIGSNTYFTENWYGAAGMNIRVPIFNGFRFSAEATEADLRAKASSERTRDLTNRIARDVRTAWLTASTARQRMVVTSELVKQANTALDLAKTRYQLGLSSIVELSQAQLQQTEAQIEDANARFEFEADTATLRFQTASQP